MNMKDLLAYSAKQKAIKVAKWNLEKDVDCSPLTDKEWILSANNTAKSATRRVYSKGKLWN